MKRAPVIVLGCSKGGIGRTTLAVNMSAMLALARRSTLLVDLDPKGDATQSLGLKDRVQRKSLTRLGDPWAFLKDTIPCRRPPGLDLWPGGQPTELLRVALGKDDTAPVDVLKRGLTQARLHYETVVIDAPPELGPLNLNALACADVLLLPLNDSLFIQNALAETLAVARRLRPEVLALGVRMDTTVSDESNELEVSKLESLGLALLEASLCQEASTVQKAAARGLPVFEYAPESRAARCFLELGRELLARLASLPEVPDAGPSE